MDLLICRLTIDEFTGWLLTHRRCGWDCWRRGERWTVVLSSPRNCDYLGITKHQNTQNHTIAGCSYQVSRPNSKVGVTKIGNYSKVIHNTKLGCRTDKESVKFRSWVCWVCCHRNALTLLSIIRIRVWQQEKTESERRRRGRRDVWKRRRQGGQTWVQSKNWRVSVSYWQ